MDIIKSNKVLKALITSPDPPSKLPSLCSPSPVRSSSDSEPDSNCDLDCQIWTSFVPDLTFCTFRLNLSYHLLFIHLLIHVLFIECLLSLGVVRGVKQ